MVSSTTLLAFVAVIFLGNFLSIWFGWYAKVWWADVMLHVLGGAWTVLLFFYLFKRNVPSFVLPASFIASLVLVLGFVMLVGVGWEWFEFTFDHFFAKERAVWRAQRGLPDTMGDLFADFAGGAVAGLYFLYIQGPLKQI